MLDSIKIRCHDWLIFIFFFQILPHPSFVYAAEFNLKNVIATGCYDKTVRMWYKNLKNWQFELIQELENHRGYVTSVCFNKNGNLLYSSDSVGTVIEWLEEPSGWFMKR